ncbi:MAG TPA: hypothetical protein VMC42_02630 [Methanoregulaceae archaeon]|nr:hypothetical protein [Methanoregulaceae archaeon]
MFEDAGLVRCDLVIHAEHLVKEALEHPVFFEDAFRNNPAFCGQLNSAVGIDDDVAILRQESEISFRNRR